MKDILVVIGVSGVILFLVALPTIRTIMGNLIAHYKPEWYLYYRERFGPSLTEDERIIVNRMKKKGLI